MGDLIFGYNLWCIDLLAIMTTNLTKEVYLKKDCGERRAILSINLTYFSMNEECRLNNVIHIPTV